MRMPGKPFICLVLSLVLLGWPGAAAAQGFKWWQNDRFQQDLGLTAEQVTRLEEIFQALQPTLKTQKETLDKFENKLSKVVSDPRTDEALVLQTVEKTEGARIELTKSRTLLTFRMGRILTSDQNVKLKALHEQWVRERRKSSTPPHRDSPGR
jgi:Spy/CpxP family protein refolding chaperone